MSGENEIDRNTHTHAHTHTQRGVDRERERERRGGELVWSLQFASVHAVIHAMVTVAQELYGRA